MKGMYTVAQLITTVHEFSAILGDSGQADIILLDFIRPLTRYHMGN